MNVTYNLHEIDQPAIPTKGTDMRIHSAVFTTMIFTLTSFTAFAESKSVQTVAFSAIPGTTTLHGNFLTRIQGYECRACRRNCSRERNYCDDSERYCGRSFVRCMRNCWKDYCR